MERKVVSGIMLTLLLSMLTLPFNIYPVKVELIDTTPPTITILEPKNKTYKGPVSLKCTIDEPTSWTGYSLNGQANETLWLSAPANVTIQVSLISELSNGTNNIRVYANDTSGNMGSSEVYFTVVLPLLTVEPKNYTASHVGQVFDVNITINDLGASWCMSYVEFKLKYNDTMLEVLDVTDGGFMKYFADQYPPVLWGEHYWTTYFFFPYTEPNYVHVVMWINHPPIWMRVYPEGNGTLATITFNAIAGPQAQCALQLVDTLLYDEWMNEVPHNTEDGFYRIFVGDLDLNGKIDIRDLAMAALAFGSYPDHRRWNPQADINNDNKVDIRDMALIAKDFGKTWTL